MAGTHSLVWDEAVKISGADPDFHRRDLWEAIEAGAYPEWELGLQIFTEEQAEALHLRRARRDQDRARGTRAAGAGRPDGAEPQPRQLLRRDRAGGVLHGARRAGHRLQQRSAAGRAASTPTSTRRSRGSAARTSTRSRSTRRSPQVHNNQRDGMHRQAIHRGRVAYEPNSLGGGCPFQAGTAGFVSFPEPMRARGAQGARQARDVRRSLHAGDALLEQPDRGREGAHRQRVPLRAVDGAGGGDSRADGRGPDERGAGAGRSRGRRARA